ncbi:hypothetical protein [Saccharolobus shibatae]|uniref:Uncharacterized protein n=1 Tax=Saccharolobus shibatae TaxID=2286 RepID=A0A8F5BS36_9CREN|nr:hypothetical protein [Saccharolobus shibatae]QXJ30322.1 hypothetical protein J5U21_p0064 [Saccharolobus shibatae]QXJ30424.1 hypothetical protein J5U21_00064 [Saccharolobus shibatae]
MYTLQVSKVNSPVNGDINQKDLLFLISLLDREDKVEFVKAFEADFWSLVEEKKLTKAAVYKFLKGEAPADERILQVVEMNEEAKHWIIERVKEKAQKALQIISKMEGNEE